jgi:serine/threonine protein phosphatase 1
VILCYPRGGPATKPLTNHRTHQARFALPWIIAQKCGSTVIPESMDRQVISAIRKLFGAGSGQVRERLPEGARIYAVGDVHGRIDLLNSMLSKIARDLQQRPCRSAVEVFLGDYVDRGPHSKAVIETLLTKPPVTEQRHCLRGNHEQALLDFLRDPEVLLEWSQFGGLETLASYGLGPRLPLTRSDAGRLRDEFAAALPPAHLSFLTSTAPSLSIGGYLFVHAGIRPGLAIDAQKLEDLLWIREPFLASQRDHGKIIVHGHTPSEEPEVLANRINIDTGAFLTGRLTCVVLEGEDVRFLDTRPKLQD